MDIPPYISDIIGGHINIKGDCTGIISDLTKIGVVEDNGKLKIPYDNSVSDLALNKDFINKFMLLLDIGVCLGRDIKLTYDPAYTAQYLKDNGVQIKSYQTISLDKVTLTLKNTNRTNQSVCAHHTHNSTFNLCARTSVIAQANCPFGTFLFVSAFAKKQLSSIQPFVGLDSGSFEKRTS